jgi:hypothetical protein
MKICLSDRGNLVQFESPAGFEHLRVSAVGEGYAVCSGAGTHGFDAGFAEQGFGPSTIIQPNGPNTFPLTITRDTTNGVFRLKQQFTRDTTEKDVTVTMTLTNRSASPVSGVNLTRYFDGDIDNSFSGNRYAHTADSVWGWSDGSGQGLMLTALTFNISHSAGVEAFPNWDPFSGGGAQLCHSGGATPSSPGNFVGRVNYSLGTIAAGGSKTVKVLYRRF